MPTLAQNLTFAHHILEQIINDPDAPANIVQRAKATRSSVRSMMQDNVDPLPDVTAAVDALQDILDNAEDHDLDQYDGEQIEAAIALLTEQGIIVDGE